MPIITHQDEILLAKIDSEVAHMFAKLGGTIDSISSGEKKVAGLYQNYTKDLQNYVRRLRDKSKQMEILAREERSGIEDGDVKEIKNRVRGVDDRIQMIEAYCDRVKDLTLQKSGLTKRMREYAKLVVSNAQIRKKIVNIGLKIEKEKNKMVAADSLSKLEDSLKDIEREFERSKKEMNKKWEQILEERVEVNEVWMGLKDSIDNFE